jgi:hypothetical protein
MGLLHRAVNLIVALTLVAIGGGGLVYFYFIDTSWPRGMAVAAGIVGATGLVTQRPRRHAIDVLSAPMPAGSTE